MRRILHCLLGVVIMTTIFYSIVNINGKEVFLVNAVAEEEKPETVEGAELENIGEEGLSEMAEPAEEHKEAEILDSNPDEENESTNTKETEEENTTELDVDIDTENSLNENGEVVLPYDEFNPLEEGNVSGDLDEAFYGDIDALIAENAIMTAAINGAFEEEEFSPKGEIDIDEYTLNFGFWYASGLENKSIHSSAAQLSKPNVYIKNKNGSIINHVWGSMNSSSNFLLGFMDDDTGKNYKIYSSSGLGGKIYSLKNDEGKIEKITGVVEKDIPNYGKVEFSTSLYPSGKNGIMHETTITNIGNTTLKFVYMKSVDTDLAGNDHVPVKMLGDKKGLYIEQGEYRLNYFFGTPNGPDNFRNWYNGGYRNPNSDTFENMNIPFFPANDLLAPGDESKDYKENDTVIGRGDSGIWMKWKPVELKPGESVSFDYLVQLYQRIENSIDAYNDTKSSDAKDDTVNTSRDDIEIKVKVGVLDKYKNMFSSGKSNIKLNVLNEDNSVRLDELKMADKVYLVDSSGDIKATLNTQDVYNSANREFNIEYNKNEFLDGVVEIKFNILGNSIDDNRYVEDTRFIEINANHEITFSDNVVKKASDKLKLKLNPITLWLPMNEAPNLEVEDKIINKGEELELRSLIKVAEDFEQGDLKNAVVISDEGGFNKDIPGEYFITFEVTDDNGAKVVKRAKVTVLNPNVPSVKQEKPNVKFTCADEGKIWNEAKQACVVEESTIKTNYSVPKTASSKEFVYYLLMGIAAFAGLIFTNKSKFIK